MVIKGLLKPTKLFTRFFNSIGKHFECTMCWSSGPVVFHTALLTVACTERMHSS